MVDRETLELLEKQDWDTIIKRVSAHAIVIAQRYFWMKGMDALPGGGRPEDVAMEAIKKLNDGTHQWNRVKHPNVLDHLKNRVEGMIYNRMRSAVHKVISGQDVAELEVEDPGSDDPDQEERARQGMEALKKAANGDEKLQDVLDGFLADLKPREIAEIMGIERGEVYDLKRKLLRRARSILGLPAKN